jgi:hypothetical protein
MICLGDERTLVHHCLLNVTDLARFALVRPVLGQLAYPTANPSRWFTCSQLSPALRCARSSPSFARMTVRNDSAATIGGTLSTASMSTLTVTPSILLANEFVWNPWRKRRVVCRGHPETSQVRRNLSNPYSRTAPGYGTPGIQELKHGSPLPMIYMRLAAAYTRPFPKSWVEISTPAETG